MTGSRARWLAWGSLATWVALTILTAVFLVLGRRVPVLPTEFGPKGFATLFAIALGTVGTLIAVRRPANPIGWILCALAIVAAVVSLAAEYARWALVADGQRSGLGVYAAWIVEWMWIPLVGGLPVIAAIFPDGRFRSVRWRTATLVAIGLAVIPAVTTALIPRLTVYDTYANPVGIGGHTMLDVANATTGLLIPLMVIGTSSAIVRFRRARGDERQQLKWLVGAMIVVAVMLFVYSFIVIVITGSSDPKAFDWAEYLMVVGFVSVPISIGFGVLKYRLYDIDVVINKAVVYGALAVFITAVYVAVVVGIGAVVGSAGDTLLSAAAAAAVALAFQPVRRRAQRFANRVVYGERATPYEVLAQLGERLAGEYAAEDVLDRVAASLAAGVGADRTVVWLRVGRELRPTAWWPNDAMSGAASVNGDTVPERIDGLRAFEVRHQGELLGAIGVGKAPSDPLTPADEKLVADLAAQAGLVLRNVALIEDLRASRRRLVAAQDEERRRLERNIHDGAQQQLVALTVKARLAEQMLDRDPDKARTFIAQIQAETTEALENLRDLARGIYPPLLADKGLVAALEAQARKVPVPVEVHADGVERFGRDVEASVYFCVLEALNNVAKYANAQHVDIRLSNGAGVLRFEVTDDGVGFDRSTTEYGTGVGGMGDRLAAIGGAFEIRSRPGFGTTVAGSVPIEASP